MSDAELDDWDEKWETCDSYFPGISLLSSQNDKYAHK